MSDDDPTQSSSIPETASPEGANPQTAAAGQDDSTPRPRGLHVPAWLGAVVLAVAVAGAGFGVARLTTDDHGPRDHFGPPAASRSDPGGRAFDRSDGRHRDRFGARDGARPGGNRPGGPGGPGSR